MAAMGDARPSRTHATCREVSRDVTRCDAARCARDPFRSGSSCWLTETNKMRIRACVCVCQTGLARCVSRPRVLRCSGHTKPPERTQGRAQPCHLPSWPRSAVRRDTTCHAHTCSTHDHLYASAQARTIMYERPENTMHTCHCTYNRRKKSKVCRHICNKRLQDRRRGWRMRMGARARKS